MKALDPPSNRFDKRLRNTRYELGINPKDTKTNHFIQIPVPIVGENSLSLTSGTNVEESTVPSVLTPGDGVKLYNYGSSTIGPKDLVPRWSRPEPEVIAQAVQNVKAREKESKKKPGDLLRPPVIDKGALQFPKQKPPPPQPLGTVSSLQMLPTTQSAQLLLSRSTNSLGASGSFRGQYGSLADMDRPPSPKALRSRVLSSIDLLSDVGSEIDQETRARTASYEAFVERQSQSMISSLSPMGGGGVGAAFAAANSMMIDPRPMSSGLQLVDINRMVTLDAPPTPSYNQHQQDLALSMKLAYLSIPNSSSDVIATGGRSRPGSRARSAPKPPVSLSTQVLRLPNASAHESSVYTDTSSAVEPVLRVPRALSHELSVHTEMSGDGQNPRSISNGESVIKDGGSLSLAELKMGSEIDSSVISGKAKSSTLSSPKAAKPQAAVEAPAQGSTISWESNPLDAAPASPVAAEALLSPALQKLSPEHIQSLRQPHYQDPQFQLNPREVVYKLRGHVLNTTPYPEEVAHLTLHGKSQPLPQYLRVQLEQQQTHYLNKVRMLGAAAAQSPQRRRAGSELSHGYGPHATNALVGQGISTAVPFQNQPAASQITGAEADDFAVVPDPAALPPRRMSSADAGEGSADAAVREIKMGRPGGLTVGFADEPQVAAGGNPGNESVNGSVGSERTPLEEPMSDELESRLTTAVTQSAVDAGAGLDATEDSVMMIAAAQARATAATGDDESIGSSVQGMDGGSVRSAPSMISIVSSHSRTSSPDGTNKRSLSIRITSTGNMYEVGGGSNYSPNAPFRPETPLTPLVIQVGRENEVFGADEQFSPTKSADFSRRPSGSAMGRQSPSALIPMMDSLNRQQNPSGSLDLTVSGKGNSPGTGKGPNKTSPNRVAYVLNQASGNRPLPGAAAVSRGTALEADDRSLQSVGNYSAITDEGFPVSPTPGINAQAPLSKTAPLGGSKSKLHPGQRLEGIKHSDADSINSSIPEPTLPYQVHRKVMGWKLTSVQRRRNLVGMLDLVNSTRQEQQRTGGRKSAPEPQQVPYALLRTGRGKRVRIREIPPLGKLASQLASVQDAQMELQNSQVLLGFQQSASLQLLKSSSNLALSKNNTSRASSRKSTGRNPLNASTSNLANLAIRVETMGRYLVEEEAAQEKEEQEQLEQEIERQMRLRSA